MSDKKIGFKLELDDGKYTYIRYEQGGQEALRYGDPWRELTGDNLILFLGFKVEELLERNTKLERELNEAKERLDWYEEKGLEADINFNGIIEHNIPGHEWPYVLAGTAHKLKADRDQWKAMAQELASELVYLDEKNAFKNTISRFNELNKP